jgi:branched-subunit amino acid transport protein AzlD
MPRPSFRIDIHGIGGLIVLAIVIVLAWWLLGAILSMTLGHLLLLIASGFVGYVIGRKRR